MVVTVSIQWNADDGSDLGNGISVHASRAKAVEAAKTWIRAQTIELNNEIAKHNRQIRTNKLPLRDPGKFVEEEDAIYDSHEEIGVLFTDKEVL
jgi:hypothetical protein